MREAPENLYYVVCQEVEDDVYHIVSATYEVIKGGGRLKALCGTVVFVEGFVGVGAEVSSEGGFCGACQV
jgi:hypothetical protein